MASRLDDCNSLVSDIPKKPMSQLQKRQNQHWLPVKQRINFKILLPTNKAQNGLAPVSVVHYAINLAPVGFVC